MKQKIQRIILHPLISGSSIIFIASFVANIINYVFNLAMGRMLSVSEYGLLLSLSSIFILLGVFNTSYVSIFSKFSAKYFATNDQKGLHSLYSIGFRFIFMPAVVLLGVLVVLSPIISRFLHVSDLILTILISFAVFFSFITAMPSGILQGKMRFWTIGGLNILAPVVKLMVAVVLILMGFTVFGAVVGIVIASAVVPLVGFFLINKYNPRTHHTSNEFGNVFKKEFFKYSFTTFLVLIGLTLLSNTDILLVRHYFGEVTSGHYAALSLMGKAIFYFTSPINFVFFPLIAQKKEKNERLFEIVLLTVGLVTLASVVISFVYFAFPNLVLAIFFPAPEYRVLTNYLGIFSLYILVFSVMSIFSNFFLSIGRTEIYKFTLSAAVLQIVLIVLFHNSLYQVIGILFAVSAILLLFFLVYYFKHGKD